MNDAIRMQISAFVDGELPDNEADLLLRRMGQDAELRLRVAEYLAIGRALRGEAFVRGVDRIHERVAAELDDKPFEASEESSDQPTTAAVKPLAGIAIAASVALIAIFGLQQMTAIDEIDNGETSLAVTEADPGYTVPQPLDEQLKQYYRLHGAAATEFGANGINSRFVSLRISEQLEFESDTDGDATSEALSDEQPTQP